MKFIGKLAAAALAVTAASVSANAATFNTGDIPWGPNSLGGAAIVVNVPRFDINLGTLTRIDFFLTSTLEGRVGLASIGVARNYNNFNASTGASANFAGVIIVTNATDLGGPFSGTVPANTQIFLPNESGATDTDTDSTFLLAGFAPFIGDGPGTYNVTINTPGFTFSGTTDSGMSFTPEGTLEGTVRVVYTFDGGSIAPEPGTFALLALGFVAGGVAIRRRK